MNEEYTIELKERQYMCLKDMVEKYGLADESKAVRCLINFAIELKEHEDNIFNETRCSDC